MTWKMRGPERKENPCFYEGPRATSLMSAMHIILTRAKDKEMSSCLKKKAGSINSDLKAIVIFHKGHHSCDARGSALVLKCG